MSGELRLFLIHWQQRDRGPSRDDLTRNPSPEAIKEKTSRNSAGHDEGPNPIPAIVRHCMAKKQKFLTEDPGEDVNMPQTKPVKKPVLLREQILALIGAIEDIHSRSVPAIRRDFFVVPARARSWACNGNPGMARFYCRMERPMRANSMRAGWTKDSKAPIPVPEQVRPVIEAWRKACKDPSPEALMFPTFGRGKRKGQAVPGWGKNFLVWRIRRRTPRVSCGKPAFRLRATSTCRRLTRTLSKP